MRMLIREFTFNLLPSQQVGSGGYKVMSTNTDEYLTIKKATGKLIRAVQFNIIALGAELFSVGLINHDNYTSLRNETRDAVSRAADLVDYVTNRVEQSPDNYHTFVKALKEDEATYKDVLKILEPIYRAPDANGSNDQAGAVAQPSTTAHSGTQPGTFSINNIRVSERSTQGPKKQPY